MELTPRKKAILAEIVKAHIETGEPIGSKILSLRLENSPSTATLRNEMSELCDLGYLEQPHTSAGRVPTSKAYRFYVSSLMGKNTLSDEGKQVIDLMLSEIRPDPEVIGTAAAEILSRLTGLPSISASSIDDGVKLKRVNLMPMGKGAAVIFVITEDGRTRSRLVRWNSPLTSTLEEKFNNIIRERVIGKDASLLDMAELQSIVVSSGLDALSLAPLLSCVFDMAKELSLAKANLSGATNLFSVWDKEADARRILDLLGTADAVHNIFSGVKQPLEIIFGDDTGYSELKPTGMIVASYGDGKELGRIAVIGPTRMAYDSILPSVEYLAERVGNIMSEILNGLED